MDYKLKYFKYKNKYQNLKHSLDLDKQAFQTGGKKLNKKSNSTKYKQSKYKNKQSRQMELKSKESEPEPEPNYTLNVSEPWFSLIKLGIKTVEGRLSKGKFKEMKPGDIIRWTNQEFDFERSFYSRIVSKIQYTNFEEYLDREGLDKCLPGIDNLENGLSVYYKYYTKQNEKEYGVVAIKLELL